jgi:hypothetical protein
MKIDFPQLALFPFIAAFALSSARILVSMHIAEWLYTHAGACCISFERYPIALLFVITVLEWTLESRSTQNGIYAAAVLNVLLRTAPARIANVLSAYCIFRLIEAPFGKLKPLDLAQKVCVLMLFSLVAIPDSNLTQLLFTRPRFLASN